jgi:hypothetical protein
MIPTMTNPDRFRPSPKREVMTINTSVAVELAPI